MENKAMLYGGVILSKLLQWMFVIIGGILGGVEAAIPHFFPCAVLIALDIASAYALARRVKLKYPDRADGKFKSKFKHRVLFTFAIVFFCIILAHHVDANILKDGSGQAVGSVMWAFITYQAWSILENCSSESDNMLAKTLQKFMVNKAERHFNIDLSEFKKDKDKKEE